MSDFENILEQLTEAVLVTNGNEICYVNNNLAQFLGFQSKDAFYQNISDSKLDSRFILDFCYEEDKPVIAKYFEDGRNLPYCRLAFIYRILQWTTNSYGWLW